MNNEDALSKAVDKFRQLQNMGLTGTVRIKLELIDGGIRSCYFGTDQKIHLQKSKQKTDIK